MSFPAGYTIYTFAPLSVTFARVPEGEQFTPWAFPKTNYSYDSVLGTAGLSYLDIGGDDEAKLELMASCLSAVDRQTLRLGRNATGVLSNTRGRSNTYTLVEASPVDSTPYTLYLISLVFVLRPT